MGEDAVPSLGRDESDGSVDQTRSTLTLHSTMPTPHGKMLTAERQAPDLLVLLRHDAERSTAPPEGWIVRAVVPAWRGAPAVGLWTAPGTRICAAYDSQ